MNRKKIIKFEIIAIIFSLAIGTLLHFTYNISGNNRFVATFSSVNESTWEHLKLAFFPILLISIIFYYSFKDNKSYIKARTVATLMSMLFITTFFYTYTGIIGENYSVINILTFVFGILLGEYASYRILISKKEPSNLTNVICITLIALIWFFFIRFTFSPPRLNYFRDPIDKTYGIK